MKYSVVLLCFLALFTISTAYPETGSGNGKPPCQPKFCTALCQINGSEFGACYGSSCRCSKSLEDEQRSGRSVEFDRDVLSYLVETEHYFWVEKEVTKNGLLKE